MTGTASTTDPRRVTPGRPLETCAIAAAMSVAVWAVAPIIGHPRLAWPALVAGFGLTIALGVRGARTARRHDLTAQLELALLGELGGRPGTIRLEATRWTGGWPGTPRRLTLRYPPSPSSTSPTFVSTITNTAGTVLEGTYRSGKHDVVRGRLQLRLTEAPIAKAADSPQVDRARRVVTDLLGTSASVKKLDVDDSGEVRSIDVTHNAGAKLVASGYRARIERTVSSLLPGRWRAQWDMEGDRVRFEVRPSLPDCVWLEEVEPPADDLMDNYGDVEIPFGVDEDGEIMSWRPAELPQAVVIGGTGSGKTSTTHALLVQFSHYGWPIWVADGKAIEFLGFRDWPNVQVVASTPEEQVAVIHRAWALMEHRYSLVTRGQAQITDFEPLLLFVDEYADLKGALTSWYGGVKQKGDPRQPPTFDEVASIIRKGRTARVHVVLALQRPDAEFLGGEMRDNLGMRISVGRLSPQGAQMMWEHPAVGVSLPRGKRGRAIAASPSGAPVEMQCYRTPDPAKAVDVFEIELLDQLRPAESTQERLLILPPKVEHDLDSGEAIDLTFTDYAQADWARASDHPELDPLAQGERAPSLASGREMASAMAVLGLTGASRQPQGGRPRLAVLEQRVQARDDETSPEEDTAYGAVTSAPATAVEVGDLIEVDGVWAVVEDEPVPDVDDPDSVSIAWRDDDDRCGDLLVPSTEYLQVRHPNEGI